MTLLDAQPPKPRSVFVRYLRLIIIMVVIAGLGMTFFLWDYPEQRAVSRFLTALEQGNYQEAYRLWQPAQTYTYDNFLHDWGPQGDYGKIRNFEILGSRSKGQTSVIVTVRINNQDPPLDISVDRQTQGLAYSPF